MTSVPPPPPTQHLVDGFSNKYHHDLMRHNQRRQLIVNLKNVVDGGRKILIVFRCKNFPHFILRLFVLLIYSFLRRNDNLPLNIMNVE